MVDSFEVFGRTVYAECIKALIVGLPDLSDGRPALSMFAAVWGKGADALPTGYGRPFAKGVYRGARRVFWDHDVVEEAMLTLVTTAVRGRVYLTPGCRVAYAQRYVLAAVANSAKNVLRSRGRKRRGEVPLDLEPVLDERRMQYADPRSLEEEDRVAAVIDLRGVAERSLEPGTSNRWSYRR